MFTDSKLQIAMCLSETKRRGINLGMKQDLSTMILTRQS